MQAMRQPVFTVCAPMEFTFDDSDDSNPTSPLMTPTGLSPAGVSKKAARISLGDWWAGADDDDKEQDSPCDGEDSPCKMSDCEEGNEDNPSSDEDNHSTTASERGGKLAADLRSPVRSPRRKRNSARHGSPGKWMRDGERRPSHTTPQAKMGPSLATPAKMKVLPQIFCLGDDWDQLAREWHPTTTPSPSVICDSSSPAADEGGVDPFAELDSGNASTVRRRRRHTMNSMFSSSQALDFSPLQRTAVAAALDACLQATPEDERSTVAIGFALMPPGAPFSSNTFASSSGASASSSGFSEVEEASGESAQAFSKQTLRGQVLEQMNATMFNTEDEAKQMEENWRSCVMVDATDDHAFLSGMKKEVPQVQTDTSICGRWSCGSQSYEIFESGGKLFFDQGPIGSGELVLGGEWYYAQLKKSDGDVCGTVRLRYIRNYQNSDGEIMSNFQMCGGSWGGDIVATKAEEDDAAKEQRMAKTPTKSSTNKIPKRVYVHPIIINLPRYVPGVTAENKRFSKMFEGADGALKAYIAPEEGKDLDVSCLAGKGKKRTAAPMPEEFAKAIQKLVLKSGADQEYTIQASQKYGKTFGKVQGLDEEQFAPSLEGGVDAVMELMDDVRTGAWNIAAFIFKRG